MRRQFPQKILCFNRDKGIRKNRIPFSEFYSSISSAMTVRIAITTGIHFPRLIFFPPIWLWSETNGTGGQFHSPTRYVFQGTAASSAKAQGGTVGKCPSCLPPQSPFEQFEQCRSKLWKRLNDAAGIRQQGCDVRTHDAESVTSVCSEHHCRMACSGAYRIFLAEEDWCCLQDSQVSPLRSHFSWKIPSWNCSAPQLFPRFGWT